MRGDPGDRRRRGDAAEALPESGRDEAAIFGCALDRNERIGPPREDEDPGVRRRRGIECAPWQPAGDTNLVERSPNDAVERTRPGDAIPERDAPFDDQVRADEPNLWVVEEEVQQVGRAVKGKVRNDPERHVRKSHLHGVLFDDVDVRPTTAKPFRPLRIKLDRDHPAGSGGELCGYPAAAGSNFENEIVVTDARVADEPRGDCFAAKEMLATRRGPSARRAPTCHGRTVS